MDALEERILDHEICVLADETIRNDFRFDLNSDTPRSLMARAQMVMVKELMYYLMRLDDWSEFEPDIWDYVDLQREQYQQSRAAGDRQMARIYLARVRVLTRLLNRLNNFKRSRLIGLGFPPLAPGESPPPLALRQLKEELVRRGEWDQEDGLVTPAPASLESGGTTPDL